LTRAAMRTRIMYIEYKGDGLVGSARIGRVSISKSGGTLHYGGKSFQSLKGSGFKANYYDVETHKQYWISGPRRDGADALYLTNVPTPIDEDVLLATRLGAALGQPQPGERLLIYGERLARLEASIVLAVVERASRAFIVRGRAQESQHGTHRMIFQVLSPRHHFGWTIFQHAIEPVHRQLALNRSFPTSPCLGGGPRTAMARDAPTSHVYRVICDNCYGIATAWYRRVRGS
jgi:hypothetical protein